MKQSLEPCGTRQLYTLASVTVALDQCHDVTSIPEVKVFYASVASDILYLQRLMAVDSGIAEDGQTSGQKFLVLRL